MSDELADALPVCSRCLRRLELTDVDGMVWGVCDCGAKPLGGEQMKIGKPCQVLRCTREANTVFQVRGAGDVIEVLVCDPHNEQLSSSTGWFYDYELRRIRIGADGPAVPTRYKSTWVQDSAQVFTLTYERDGEESELELFLSTEARHGLIGALGGVVSDKE